MFQISFTADFIQLMEHNGKPFRFKLFDIYQREDVFKVNTDGVLCAAWVSNFKGEHIIEIGSGTGVMSLILAQKFPGKKIKTIELQSEAAALTQFNIIQNLPFSKNIECIEQDITSYHSNIFFDLIVSNPPYYEQDSLSVSLQDKIAKHHLGLTRIDFLKSIEKLSHAGTLLYVVYPMAEGKLFIEEAATFNWFPIHILKVKPTHDKPFHRMVICLSRNKKEVVIDEIQILDELGYTLKYREMMRDYYLIF